MMAYKAFDEKTAKPSYFKFQVCQQGLHERCDGQFYYCFCTCSCHKERKEE